MAWRWVDADGGEHGEDEDEGDEEPEAAAGGGLGSFGASEGGLSMSLVGGLVEFAAEDHEDGRDEEEGRAGGEDEAADDGAAEGAFCSPPVPTPRAMGTMPMIMARAVMRTGRMRT